MNERTAVDEATVPTAPDARPRPHWLSVRAYGVTADGVTYNLPLQPPKVGRCPVEGCHCQDPA